MLYQLLRTSLRRSTSILNVSVRGASGTMYFGPPCSTPRALLVGTRSFSAAFALRAAAAKGATDKKTASQTTTSKTKARKRVTAAKKKPLKKKKGSAKEVVKSKKKKLAAKPVKPKRLLKKDLAAPFKRPQTAWVRFAREYYQQHKDSNTGMKKYLTQASTEWRQMTDEQKAAYHIPQHQEWADYSKKRKEWKASLSRTMRHAIRSRRKDYRSGQKTPLNPWFQYVKENYHKHPFPPTASTGVEKFKALNEYFKQFVTDAEKQELAERATREFATRAVQAKETGTS